MIGSFFRWFSYKLNYYNNENCQPMISHGVSKRLSTVDRSLGEHKNTLNLQVHSATGGYVLEFTKYDPKRDQHERNLHIVTDDQDLGNAISQIITVEMMRY